MDHSIHSHFGEEHVRLEQSLERLRDAAEGADERNLVDEWRAFESPLRAHLEAEERYLFPTLEAAHPEEVAAARADHEKIRERLEELGLQVELHTVRLETVEAFLELLRAHKASEDAGLYQQADAELDAPTRERASLRAA